MVSLIHPWLYHGIQGQMTYSGCADDLSKVYIHPIIAANKMSIVCLSILQFHQLWGK